MFSPHLSLKYITYFFLSVCSLPVPCLLPCVVFVLPSACPPILLPAVCSVAAVRLLLCSVVSPSPCLDPSSVCAPPEALRRPSACPVVCVLSCVSCLSVTRQPSGARRCGSVGRCTAYMSPALPPLAYVLPCVPLLVPWLVLPAACCRLVVTIACMPLYPRRRRCGAASAM